jgi:hypothetical protein
VSENHPQPTTVEKLLEQDTVLSSFDFGRFRMNLEETIKRLEDRARLIHRAALVSLAIFIGCVVLGPLLASWHQLWILRIWSGCGLIALLTTGVLTGIDHYKYRPALKRKQRDSVWAAIDQLQLEVAELREKLK